MYTKVTETKYIKDTAILSVELIKRKEYTKEVSLAIQRAKEEYPTTTKRLSTDRILELWVYPQPEKPHKVEVEYWLLETITGEEYRLNYNPMEEQCEI